MSDLQEYKCPSCGGALEFNSDTQKMKCPFCDSEFTVEEVENAAKSDGSLQEDSMNWTVNAGGEWQSGETDNLKTYVCKSCGGEIVGEGTTAASECPFCGNPVVMTGQFSGALRPDIIIPFKKNKEDAKSAYKKHIAKKKLLPKEFKNENHIDEIKGIYVPFWLFDAQAFGSVKYEATRTRTWRDSKNEYTETSYFDVSREGSAEFAAIPVDGSEKMPDDLMESIEPYSISDGVDFKTAYLSGYLADRYDVDAEQSIDRANARVKKSVEELFRETVNSDYTSVIPKGSYVNVSNGTARYALYPVWLLNTTFKGNKYTFAMNGQTGKFVGNLPIDKGILRKILALTMLGTSIGVYGIATLIHIITYFL